jgi:LPXTG-site transpeptidase (sortase) family protein
MRYIKRVLLAIAIFAIIFLTLNWQYFRVQVGYYYDPPAVQDQRPDDPGKQDERVEPNRIKINSLAVDSPLIYVDEINEDVFQRALRDGVVHYPNTAMPGENGNAYYFGHSSDFPTTPGNYKTVFALLPHIEIGSVIEVSDPDGQLYRYKVEVKRPVESDDLSVLNQDESKKQLSLQTSYPVGTFLKRYVVTAYLIE